MSNLRIHIQQTQLYNIQGQAVYYTGVNAAQLNVNTGVLPAARQWRNFGNYIDITDYVANIDKLSLTWTEDRDSNGLSVSGSSFVKKSASGSLYFEGEGYELIKIWLIDDISATLNKIDVKIHDVGCDIWYEDYQISNEDIVYCEGEICEFSVSIRQKDQNYQCIQRTLISDNHQGWFPPDGLSTGKKHPRFAYCNEIRPNGQLVAIWKLGTFNFMITNTVLIPIILLINAIIFAINGIIAIIRFLVNLFGGGNPPNYLQPIKIGEVLETQEQTFVESAGCGREHPAPLIRDYIKNVCDKCGITVDALSAPIFFDAAKPVPFASSGDSPYDTNPHYRACYFNAPNKRGIRRTELPSPFLAPDFNDTNYWIEDNRPIKTLDLFLDDLKGLYNAEWRIVNNVLYFQRKDYFLNTDYIYDFSANAADRNKILQGVCFEWNQVKYPVYTQGLYANDPSDKCGNEALGYMNDIVSHGSRAVNPNLEGVKDLTQQFGGTRFRLDGATPDYICDAAQQNQNGGIFSSIFPIMKNVLARFTNYELLLNEETASLPKILIWDGVSYDAAQCERFYAPQPNLSPVGMPPVNTVYNSSARPWAIKHPYNTFVKGQNFNLGSFPPGFYTVRSFYTTLTYQRPALLVNYPMFMDAEFTGTMWDLFHFIDDPVRYASAQQAWYVKISLCCEDIKRLGLSGNGFGSALGQKVKLNRPFYPDGKIKEITLNNDPENEFGAYIEIKGE